MSVDEKYAAVAKQLEDARKRLLADYERHALTCPDPVGCEVRAWQELFRNAPAPAYTLTFWSTR